MTRVNLVPPEELADQHLFAEFRELKMVPKSLARSLRAAERKGAADPVAHVLERVPRHYVLGQGHVSFFYPLGAFLRRRYAAVREELLRRGSHDFDRDAVLDPDLVYDRDPRLLGEYTPTPEALALNRERIQDRIAAKPAWYRHTRPLEARA